MAAEPQKLTRDNTMQATAKEGIKFLEKADPDLAEECKAVTNDSTENGAGDAPEVAKNGDDQPKMTRDNTMVTTAQAGKEFLEKQGGVNADAKTRSQEAELNKSVEEEKENGEDEKQAPKRPAADEEEAEDVKKQKTEDEAEEAKEEVAQEKESSE